MAPTGNGDYATWIPRLRKIGISEDVILKLYKKYGNIPDYVVEALEKDDRLCGIGVFTAGTDPECAEHDTEMLLKELGFPVSGNLETQMRFAGAYAAAGVAAAIMVVKAPIFAVLGSVGGGLIWIWKDLAAKRAVSEDIRP